MMIIVMMTTKGHRSVNQLGLWEESILTGWSRLRFPFRVMYNMHGNGSIHSHSWSLNHIKSNGEQQDPFEKSRMLFWAETLDVSSAWAQLYVFSIYLRIPFSNHPLMPPLSFKFLHFISHHFFLLCFLFTISILNI